MKHMLNFHKNLNTMRDVYLKPNFWLNNISLILCNLIFLSKYLQLHTEKLISISYQTKRMTVKTTTIRRRAVRETRVSRRHGGPY